MIDLRLEATHQFWRDFDKRVLYRIVTSMEAVDYWTVDGDEGVEAALDVLTESLEHLNSDTEMGQEDNLITMVANLKSSRCFRVLQSMDAAKQGLAAKLISYAEEKSKKPDGREAKLFLGRNMAFERMQLLARIFAPERISLVVKALEASDVT